MDKLVILENEKNILTNSLIISRGMKLSHYSVTKLVDKYLERLNRMGGVIQFEIEQPKGKKGGRPFRLAWLNKKQFLFLATLMRNSETVLDFKEKLINEFERLQNMVAHFLSQRENEEWIEKREQGKLSRRVGTDTIQVFIDYAKGQGSAKSDKYYMLLSKMENKALFVVTEKFPNLREVLDGMQLGIASSADIAVSKALKDGMEQELPYKEIYQLAKKRLEAFSEIVGKTMVPSAELGEAQDKLRIGQ